MQVEYTRENKIVENPEYIVKFFGTADYVVDLKEATCLVNEAKNEMTICLEEPTLTPVKIDVEKTEGVVKEAPIIPGKTDGTISLSVPIKVPFCPNEITGPA